MRKTLRWIGGIFVCAWIAAAAALFLVMHWPVVFGKVMRHVPGPAFIVIPFKQLWFVARAGKLSVGDPAPAFALATSDGKRTVRLAAFRGNRPVVLVFGSYT